MGESADNHSTHKNSLEGRLEGIERKMKDLGISLDGKGHKSEIEKLERNILGGIDKRLTVIEEKHMQDFIKRLGDYEKKHMSEFDQMKARMGDVDKALKECANIEHYLGMDRKHGALTEQQLKDSEAARSKHGELQAKVAVNESTIDSIARKLGDGLDGMMRKMNGLETSNSRFKTLFDEVDNSIRGEKSSRETGAGKAEERLARLESLLGGNMGTWSKDLESTQGKMRDVTGKVDAQKLNFDNFKSIFDQRLVQLEMQLTEIPGGEVLKEMDQRFTYMQDDQKRSRDILESAMTEQIRLEHSQVHNQASQIKEQWDREVKARQAYQENYKELLGQERHAREAQEMHFDSRLQKYERNVFVEIQRIWSEIQKVEIEPRQPIVVQQPAPQYVMSPRQMMIAPPQQARYIQETMTPAMSSGMPMIGTTSFTPSIVGPSTIMSPGMPQMGGTMAYDMLSGSSGLPVLSPAPSTRSTLRQSSNGNLFTSY